MVMVMVVVMPDRTLPQGRLHGIVNTTHDRRVVTRLAILRRSQTPCYPPERDRWSE